MEWTGGPLSGEERRLHLTAFLGKEKEGKRDVGGEEGSRPRYTIMTLNVKDSCSRTPVSLPSFPSADLRQK